MNIKRCQKGFCAILNMKVQSWHLTVAHNNRSTLHSARKIYRSTFKLFNKLFAGLWCQTKSWIYLRSWFWFNTWCIFIPTIRIKNLYRWNYSYRYQGIADSAFPALTTLLSVIKIHSVQKIKFSIKC